MKLEEQFSYVDPSNVQWVAPIGSLVDGASIPQVGWSIVGSPFTGLYRDASVIHDVACVEKKRHWRQVHRAFYFAMRASGVDEIRAKAMYLAVYRFGPRWVVEDTITMVPNEKISAVRQSIEAKNPGENLRFFISPSEGCPPGLSCSVPMKLSTHSSIQVRGVPTIYPQPVDPDSEAVRILKFVAEANPSIDQIERLN